MLAEAIFYKRGDDMAWGGKGRSGIGDQYTGGTWEDWDGLSPNGKQYKNQLTQETRNLSGADYWHARKSDNARVLNKALPDHFNPDGTANFGIYVEEEKKPNGMKRGQKKQGPFEYQVFPSQKAFDKIEDLIQTVEQKYLNLEIDDEEYDEMTTALENKLEKAWVKVCKEKEWYAEESDYQQKQQHGVGSGVFATVRNIVNSVTANLVWRGLIK